MRIQKTYPGNGDIARIEILLNEEEIEKLKQGAGMELEEFIGPAPDEELPVKLIVKKDG